MAGDRFDGVKVVRKANIYYDGKVSSRTVLFADGAHAQAGHAQHSPRSRWRHRLPLRNATEHSLCDRRGNATSNPDSSSGVPLRPQAR